MTRELRSRANAAAAIATEAISQPDDAVAEALMRLAAGILVHRDHTPHRPVEELVDVTTWEQAG